MSRYIIEVIDEDKFGDIEVTLDLRDTKLDRQGRPVSARGTVVINGIEIWGEHSFSDYLEEYGFLIIDNQIQLQ
jgi:hypothetical protein